MADEDDVALIEAKVMSLEDKIAHLDAQIGELQREKRAAEKERDKLISSAHRLKAESLGSLDWNRTDYPWSEKLKSTLQQIFKIQNLRPFQLPTMNAVLSGHNVTLIMPTGGGKSLCYQLPALILDGFSLVVSPLVSLMEDQMMALRRLEYPAEMLSASASREEVTRIQNAMTDPKGKVKLIFVTPEKLGKSKRFIAKLQKAYEMGRFSLLAIDEVHCCSQWGHDFRRDYQFLGVMRGMFPKTPFLGLTATGTARVIEDVHEVLSVQDSAIVFRDTFNRPNLFYEVVNKPGSQKDAVAIIADYLKHEFRGKSGIIYTLTIKDAEELTTELLSLGLRVGVYHASLEPTQRSAIHQKWATNAIQAIVATVAFGMGIDKPDVRFVLHHSLSKSIENYYQESGRAGRDGQPAKCLLMYRFADVFRIASMVCGDRTGIPNLNNMMAYAMEPTRCRRQLLAQYFEADWNSTHCAAACDNCKNQQKTGEEVDITRHVQHLYKVFDQCALKEQKLTGPKLVDTWIQTKEASYVPPGRDRCEHILSYLLLENYLRMDFHYTPYNVIVYLLPVGTKRSMIQTGSHRVMMPAFGKKTADSSAKSRTEKRKKPADSEKHAKPDSQSSSSGKKQKKNALECTANAAEVVELE